MRYFFGQTGNINTNDVEYNPYIYLREDGAEEFLCKLSQSSLQYADYKNNFIDGFLKTEIIKNINGYLHLNIPTLLIEDKTKIISVSEKYAKKLYDSIVSESLKIKEICRKYEFNHNLNEKYMLVVICCICLDWYALELFEEKGFLIWKRKMPGSNNEYTLTGHAYMNDNESEPYIEPYYANSSYSQIYSYILASFGSSNNTIIRQCFPEILSLPHENLWECYKEYLSDDFNKNIDFAKCFAAEMTLAESELNILYEKSGYKRKCEILIPVFTKQDDVITNTIQEIMKKILLDWITDYYSAIESELSNVTPIKNKIPFIDIFNYIWHNIFGICNGMLCENDIVFNPRDKKPFDDYLPFVIYK